MATWMTKALEQKKGPPPVLRPDEEVEHKGAHADAAPGVHESGGPRARAQAARGRREVSLYCSRGARAKQDVPAPPSQGRTLGPPA